MPDLNEKPPPSAAPTALEAALALIDLGPLDRIHDAEKWTESSQQVARHCAADEDVTEAAARIIAAEYRRAYAALAAIEERYTDGSDTYADWEYMGSLARTYLFSDQNENTPHLFIEE